jgi:hypothetical protein
MASVSRNSELARTRAAPGSALRSRSTSPARMAAILPWATAGRGGVTGNGAGAGVRLSPWRGAGFRAALDKGAEPDRASAWIPEGRRRPRFEAVVIGTNDARLEKRKIYW